MSAFICSKNHISALANYACVQKVWLDGRSATSDDFESIYKVLASENVRSVCARYDGDKPSDYDDFVSPVSLSRYLVADPVQIIKLCDCLDYQSCETDDWKETLAYRTLQRIRNAAIDSLPGYDDAKWAIA